MVIESKLFIMSIDSKKKKKNNEKICKHTQLEWEHLTPKADNLIFKLIRKWNF